MSLHNQLILHSPADARALFSEPIVLHGDKRKEKQLYTVANLTHKQKGKIHKQSRERISFTKNTWFEIFKSFVEENSHPNEAKYAYECM